MSFAIQTNELSKQFPIQSNWRSFFLRRDFSPPAVDRISLTVNQGEIFGLVGPNGAGKTTLIKMLSTLVLPTSGGALVNGIDLRNESKIKRTIGLVTSDERSFFWRLSGRQNLEFFAVLDDIPSPEISPSIEKVLEAVNLIREADNKFLTYSTGMRQRLSIARALITQPKLLFLDEPTQGLDPAATRQIHDLVRNQLTREQGMTVFMTSHHLDEVELLCDRVAFMFDGKIKACGTMDELRREIGTVERYHIQIQNWTPEKHDLLSGWLPDIKIETFDEGNQKLSCSVSQNENDLERIIDSVRNQDWKIVEIVKKSPSLEFIFDQLSTEDTTGINFQEKEQSLPSAEKLNSVPKRRSAISEYFEVAWAFFKRDLRSEVSYRLSFLLQFFNVFFSVAVFYFVAVLFGEGAAPFLKPYGGDYFSFVLIGIAFAGYFNTGLSSFSNSLRRAQTTGTLEAMLSTPTRLSTIILSSSQWSYLMTTLRVVVYLLIGTFILDVNLTQGNFWVAIIVLVLTVISFSSLGIIAAGFIMVLKQGNPVTWIFGTASSLLGGVYYPIEVMPIWMQSIAKILPVTYALRAMRLALLKGAPISSLLPDILVLMGFCVVLMPISLLIFRLAVRRARVDGSLTHY